MKKIISISLIALLGIFFSQCEPEDDLVTQNAIKGGLIDVNKESINFALGEDKSYNFELYLHQNKDVQIKTVKIYKSFYANAIAWSHADSSNAVTDSISAKWSNEMLEETFTIANSESHWIYTTPLDFNGLVNGLSFDDGTNLPATEDDATIGDYFKFAVEAIMSDASSVMQAYNVKVSIAAPYAGTYDIVAGTYFRIGVESPDFQVGETALIESINSNTYVWSDWPGSNGWAGNQLYFQVSPEGIITYPAEWDGVAQILNDQPLSTCTLTPAYLSNVNCAGSNFTIKDEVEGKHQLLMVHGYFTAGSGPREFDMVLVKQ